MNTIKEGDLVTTRKIVPFALDANGFRVVLDLSDDDDIVFVQAPVAYPPNPFDKLSGV